MITIRCPICGALLKTDDKGMFYCEACPYKEEHKDEKERVFGKPSSKYSPKEVKVHKTPYNTYKEWEGEEE